MTRDQLVEIFGDHQVVPMLCDLWDVIQAWDDAEDGDPNDHSKGYETAMIGLHSNPAYAQLNMPFLVAQMFYDWHAANVFERDCVELHKAYMLRAGWYRLVLSVVHMIYGPARAKELSPVIYKVYGEKFEDYQEEMLSCQIQSQQQ